jgi:poly(A) polymerase
MTNSDGQQTDFHKRLLSPGLLLLADVLQPPRFRIVGGAVRDCLMERPIHDIDLATSLLPEEVIERLEAAGFKAIPTGLSHGTVTAVVRGETFEITTLRKDIATDGRRAEVAFTDDWIEDAARRDFTINALSLSIDGVLYDPFRGVDDCKQGKIRFVGDSTQRIKEDYLRILRLFRFQGQLGIHPISDDDLKAVRLNKDGIESLSGERLWQELSKTLISPRAETVLPLMIQTGVLATFLTEPFRCEGWSDLNKYEFECDQPNPIRRLVYLLGLDKLAMKLAAQRLKLSRKERTSFQAFATPPNTNVFNDLVLDGYETALSRVLIQAALSGSPNDSSLTTIRQWDHRALPLTGQNLRDLGIEEGKEIGLVLRRVQTWWIDNSCQPGHQDCLDFVKSDLFIL